MAQAKKGGKKNRKYGRWSRAPSMKAYVATDRLLLNRLKRAERHAKRVVKQKAKQAG